MRPELIRSGNILNSVVAANLAGSFNEAGANSLRKYRNIARPTGENAKLQ